MGDDIFDDEKRVNKLNQSRELELFSIRQVIKTENGRNFMWRCLENCCTFENIFNDDPNQHSYNAGGRKHGLWLIDELKSAARDNYFKMLKENDHG